MKLLTKFDNHFSKGYNNNNNNNNNYVGTSNKANANKTLQWNASPCEN